MTRRGPAPCQASSSVPSVRNLWELDKYRYDGRDTRPEMRKLCWTEQYAMEMEAWYGSNLKRVTLHQSSTSLPIPAAGRGEETGGCDGGRGMWWGLGWDDGGWGCLVSVKCKQGGETERERPRWGRKLIRCSNITRAVNEVSRYFYTYKSIKVFC